MSVRVWLTTANSVASLTKEIEKSVLLMVKSARSARKRITSLVRVIFMRGKLVQGSEVKLEENLSKERVLVETGRGNFIRRRMTMWVLRKLSILCLIFLTRSMQLWKYKGNPYECKLTLVHRAMSFQRNIFYELQRSRKQKSDWQLTTSSKSQHLEQQEWACVILGQKRNICQVCCSRW